MEEKIVAEVAEKDFDSWCDANDIEHDVSSMNDEDRKSFEDLKSKIVKSIQKGVAVVDGDSMEYTLDGSYEGKLANMKIRVSPPKGSVFLGMDGYKDTQKMHQLHGAMSALTGLDVGVFSKMKITDWKFFQSVLTLFLSA